VYPVNSVDDASGIFEASNERLITAVTRIFLDIEIGVMQLSVDRSVERYAEERGQPEVFAARAPFVIE
jgi:uncharacterized lipoprotein YajG